MSFLRRISTQRLVALCVAAVVVIAGGTALAIAAGSGGPVPERKPLANAVHDALAAPDVPGVTARIEFTNHLISGDELNGSNPVIAGATGRLWATDDGRFRLELQSSGGDAQIVSNGRSWWAYDGESRTVYRGTVPKHERAHARKRWRTPTVGRIQRVINRVMHRATVTGPTPSNVAGEPAYTVRMSPRRNGGLLGAVELAWDAARGTPLRGAIYARGDSDPVLELKATDIQFGSVDPAVFGIPAPRAGKVERIRPHEHGAPTRRGARRGRARKPLTGVKRVRARVGFPLSTPAALAGRKRQEVALVGRGKKHGALVTYGRGLSGIAVIEHRVRPGAHRSPLDSPQLPTVSIDGAAAKELSTPLGTVLRFERGGVSYTVIASAPRAVVEAAARGL